MEVVGATAAPRRTSEPARKYPPTKLYIEDEPEKKVETFMRWKQQQRGQEGQEEDTVSETRHLSELEREIEMVQTRERGRHLSGLSEVSTESETETSEEKNAGTELRRMLWKENYLVSMSIMLEEDAPFPEPTPESLAKEVQPAGETLHMSMGGGSSNASDL